MDVGLLKKIVACKKEFMYKILTGLSKFALVTSDLHMIQTTAMSSTSVVGFAMSNFRHNSDRVLFAEFLSHPSYNCHEELDS